MEKRILISSYFAGANSYKGFHSLFDNIMDNPTSTYILKGGPGTGKSSLLKKLAHKAQMAGYDIEKIYCSSDSDSLDGITIPDTGVTVVDGTAPHIIDPLYPGAVEQIVDLGQFLDTKFLSSETVRIKKIQAEVKQLFALTYNYLHQSKLSVERLKKICAKSMYKSNGLDIEQNILSHLTSNSTRHNQYNFFSSTDKTKGHNLGSIRYLFATAFSPQGLVNLYPEILKSADSLVLLREPYHLGADWIMKTILNRLAKRNYQLIVFPCGFDPEQIDCIYIPEQNSAFLRTNYYHDLPKASVSNSQQSVNTMLLGQSTKLSSYWQKELYSTKQQFHTLIDRALQHLSEMLTVRSELENLYIEAQDFTSVDKATNDLEQKLKLY